SHRHAHAVPTRRSSDLTRKPEIWSVEIHTSSTCPRYPGADERLGWFMAARHLDRRRVSCGGKTLDHGSMRSSRSSDDGKIRDDRSQEHTSELQSRAQLV